MSMAHDNAVEALKALLWELPAEFSSHSADDPHYVPRYEFRVIKQSNVRKVHQALWELQEYFGVTDGEN